MLSSRPSAHPGRNLSPIRYTARKNRYTNGATWMILVILRSSWTSLPTAPALGSGLSIGKCL